MPILHRPETRDWLVRPYHTLYRTACLPSHQQQAAKLEALRYRFGGYENSQVLRLFRWCRATAKDLLPWLYLAMSTRGFW
jgi:hypothetical protein